MELDHMTRSVLALMSGHGQQTEPALNTRNSVENTRNK